LLFAGGAAPQEPSPALKQADTAYREGLAALNQNDLQTAQSKFEDVVRLAPSLEQGHSALGAVLVREGRLEPGIRELEKALALKPGDGSAELNLALAYSQAGAQTKAALLFERAEAAANAQKHPLPASVLEEYARVLLAIGKPVAAAARMREAAAQDPRNAELRDQLGALYAQQQDWPRAEEAFSEAIRLKPEFAMAHLHLGFVLQAEEKSGAAAEWIKAWKIAPQDPHVAFTAGKALADAGQDDQAVPILEDAVKLDPTDTAAAYQLALSLQRVNRLPEAIQLLRNVVAKDANNSEALINLGLALSQVHQGKDAVPFLQRAISLKPDNATAHQNLAAAYVQINQVDDAIVELKAALKLAPESPQIHYDLGVAYKLQDDPTAAIPELETAERLDPDAYEPHYVLGLMYMQVARYSDAAAQLEASLKLHPDNGDGWATLGSVYNKLDRLPEAVSALREASRQLPDQADAHLTLAAVLVKQNQPAEAAEERKLAANLMRAHMDLQRAEVATNSGKSALANGKIDEAIAQFREAVSFDPKYAEAHLGLADALEKQGKTSEAASERSQGRSLAGSTH
jgi:tetratricopeptide (TPR) repeat protein